MDWAKFRARLKKLRENKRLSAESVSLNMGLDKNCFWLWERGKRKPNTESIYNLSKYFNIASDFLLGLVDKELN